MSKYMDIIAGTFLLLIAVVMFIATFGIESFAVTEFGATYVPRLVSVIMAVLSLIVLVRGIKAKKALAGKEDGPVDKKSLNYKPSVLTFTLITIYILILKEVGFIISTIIYLVLQMYILSDFNKKRIALFSVIGIVFSVSLYLVFNKLFDMMLPSGILG